MGLTKGADVLAVGVTLVVGDTVEVGTVMVIAVGDVVLDVNI